MSAERELETLRHENQELRACIEGLREFEHRNRRRVIDATLVDFDVSGQAFFETLVQHLCEALRVDAAFVCQVVGPGRDRVQVVAMSKRGERVAPFEYDLAGTPCAGVVAGQICWFPENVAALFPADPFLAEHGIESYLGIPLGDPQGQTYGHLAVMHTGPMDAKMPSDVMLGIFALRTEYELVTQRVAKRLRRYQDQLRSLTAALSLAEERERRRVACGLHDTVSQVLAVCKMKTGMVAASEAVRAGSHDVRQLLGEIDEHLTYTLSTTRSLIFDLFSPTLYEEGLIAALEKLCQDETTPMFRVDFRIDGYNCTLDEDVTILVYQVVRELLNNVKRHAKATHATVWVGSSPHAMMVRVDDDGIGMDSASVHQAVATDPAGGADAGGADAGGGAGVGARTGFGLFSARERLRHVGGNLQIDSAPGRGTRVAISVPAAGDGLG